MKRTRSVPTPHAVFVAAIALAGGEAVAETHTMAFKTPGSLEPPVTAELIAEHESIQPNGMTRVGVLFTLADGWHIYAEEPGDAGLPTRVMWSVPAEATVGPLRWPTPKAFLDPGKIQTFGYDRAVVLASDLTAFSVSGESSLWVAARTTWLACKDICIPGSANLELRLPVSSGAPTRSSSAHLFDARALNASE